MSSAAGGDDGGDGTSDWNPKRGKGGRQRTRQRKRNQNKQQNTKSAESDEALSQNVMSDDRPQQPDLKSSCPEVIEPIDSLVVAIGETGAMPISPGRQMEDDCAQSVSPCGSVCETGAASLSPNRMSGGETRAISLSPSFGSVGDARGISVSPVRCMEARTESLSPSSNMGDGRDLPASSSSSFSNTNLRSEPLEADLPPLMPTSPFSEETCVSPYKGEGRLLPTFYKQLPDPLPDMDISEPECLGAMALPEMPEVGIDLIMGAAAIALATIQEEDNAFLLEFDERMAADSRHVMEMAGGKEGDMVLVTDEKGARFLPPFEGLPMDWATDFEGDVAMFTTERDSLDPLTHGGYMPTDGVHSADLPTPEGRAMDLPPAEGRVMGLPTAEGGAMGLPVTQGGAMGLPVTQGRAMGLPATQGRAMELPAADAWALPLSTAERDSLVRPKMSPAKSGKRKSGSPEVLGAMALSPSKYPSYISDYPSSGSHPNVPSPEKKRRINTMGKYVPSFSPSIDHSYHKADCGKAGKIKPVDDSMHDLYNELLSEQLGSEEMARKFCPDPEYDNIQLDEAVALYSYMQHEQAEEERRMTSGRSISLDAGLCGSKVGRRSKKRKQSESSFSQFEESARIKEWLSTISLPNAYIPDYFDVSEEIVRMSAYDMDQRRSNPANTAAQNRPIMVASPKRSSRGRATGAKVSPEKSNPYTTTDNRPEFSGPIKSKYYRPRNTSASSSLSSRSSSSAIRNSANSRSSVERINYPPTVTEVGEDVHSTGATSELLQQMMVIHQEESTQSEQMLPDLASSMSRMSIVPEPGQIPRTPGDTLTSRLEEMKLSESHHQTTEAADKKRESTCQSSGLDPEDESRNSAGNKDDKQKGTQ